MYISGSVWAATPSFLLSLNRCQKVALTQLITKTRTISDYCRTRTPSVNLCGDLAPLFGPVIPVPRASILAGFKDRGADP